MGVAVAILIRKEKDLVELFHRARATSSASAQSLSALQAEDDGALRRLKRSAVVREAGDGMYYLDEPSWAALISRRRRMSFIILTIVALVLIVVLATGKNVLSP